MLIQNLYKPKHLILYMNRKEHCLGTYYVAGIKVGTKGYGSH